MPPKKQVYPTQQLANLLDVGSGRENVEFGEALSGVYYIVSMGLEDEEC